MIFYLFFFVLCPLHVVRGNNRAGRAKTGVKLARFFRAKILTAQPVLKTGLSGPNTLFKAKKNRAGRTKFGPVFFGPII